MRYELNERLRKELKAPLGPIVPREEAFQERCVIVGDSCLSQALEDGKNPHVGIYDNFIKREPTSVEVRDIIGAWNARKVSIDNSAGGITEEAFETVKSALENSGKTKIEIKGEEDLLVLPCLLFAKEGTYVYYGQPGEGIVLLGATEKNKRKAEKILEEMRQ